MKRDIIIAVVTLVVVGAVCFTLSKTGHIFPSLSRSGSTSVMTDTSSTATPGSDKVVMRVNGEPITEREFNLVFQQAQQQQPNQFSGPKGREEFADQVAKMKALEQEAQKMGFDKDPDVAARLKFDRASIAAGFALKKLVHPPTDAQLKSYYDKEKPKFETVDLSHILIAYAGSAAAQGKPAPPAEVAMKKAQDLVAKLRGGADFATVARSASDDTASAANGGKLGPVEHGVMPPEIESVAFKLKPGEISDPVQSQFGIHIFKAGERKVQPFDQIRPMLAQKVQQESLDSTLDKLKKEAKIDLDPAFFKEGAALPPMRMGAPQGLRPQP